MPHSEETLETIALQLGRRRVRAEDRLVADLAAESMDIVNIVASLEERFGIDISDAALGDVDTAGDLCNLVRRHLDRRR
jgi:acyl carrier protein